VYETASRYASPEGGDEVSVSSITRDDIVAFYSERAVPGSTTIVLTGAVSAADGRRLVERTIGDWGGPTPKRVTTGDVARREARALVVVPKVDAPQSELRIGHVGLPRIHPDYFPVVVMNSVLGGLFNSRINLNLREAHAYTYGAFSAFDWRRQAGPFFVSTAVRTDTTSAAIQEVLLEIDRMRTERIRDDELSLATSYLNGVFPIRFETTAALAAALGNLVVYGLPSDYYDTYRSRVMAVSADDVLAAARAHLHPDRLQIVAVGDPLAIRAPLEALGIGPVVVDDPDDRADVGAS
jgi:zinc protease